MRARYHPIILALLVQACAPVPHLGTAPVPRSASAVASQIALPATAADWPADRWWTALGDPQLDSLIAEGLAGSPDVAAAAARVRGADALAQQAGAALGPSLAIDGSVGGNKQSENLGIPPAFVPKGVQDTGRITAALSFNLDLWGKNRAALAAAISEQRAAEVEVAEARLVLSTSVALAYAELAHLYASRDVAQSTLTVRDHTVELIAGRQHQELETLATLRQIEARQAAAQADLQAIDERIALQKNAIAALLGAGPDRGRAVERPAAQVSNVVGLPPQLALDLLGRRPDIVAARLRTEAAASRIKQRSAEFYPSVNLMGVGGLMSMGLGNLFKSDASFGGAGPAISLPVFNTERLQGQLKGAHAEYNAAVAGYNAALTNAVHEVADVITSRRALDGQLSSLRSAVASVQQAHEMVSRRYQGGLASYLEVLSAEDTLLSARRGLSDTESRTLALDIALAQALGGGFSVPQAN